MTSFTSTEYYSSFTVLLVGIATFVGFLGFGVALIRSVRMT